MFQILGGPGTERKSCFWSSERNLFTHSVYRSSKRKTCFLLFWEVEIMCCKGREGVFVSFLLQFRVDLVIGDYRGHN